MGVAHAALEQTSEIKDGKKVVTEASYEGKVREVARDLRCAVCQNQSVYDSNSELAKDMLNVIRDHVKAGRSKEEINQYFFERYGDYIYLEPIKSGRNMILWIGPFVALLIGALGLRSAIRRWYRNTAKEESEAEVVHASSAVKKRIEQELNKVDL
uniref:Cytochrome c-type biogenesis protein n=1 Tax=Magnetococcus massalia (strain MO-1) TaxID=451514 RepID=A0A1S7LP93_MAGMO